MARTVTAKEFRDVGASSSRAQNLAEKINTLDPSIRDRYTNTVKDFYREHGDQGYELEINQAARTPEQQRAIQATGVKSASPRNTWHTVGGAADFTIFKNGKADKGTTYKNAYETLLRPVAAKHGLANKIRNDVGHFMPEEFSLARRGKSIADFISAPPEQQGVMMADAGIPIPADRPGQGSGLLASAVNPTREEQAAILASMFPTDGPGQNPWASLLSGPSATPPSQDFGGTGSDALAAALPNMGARIAPSGILDSVAPAPAGDIQREMLASLPGALPAAPVQPVSVASLDPVTQYAPLNPAPVGEVTRAPIRDVPSNASSAPVGAVQRGLLSDLPSNLPAAPVGAVERGGMLRPASERPFTGNPNLTEDNASAFDGYWTYNGEPVTALAPTASSDRWDISTTPNPDFMMSRTGAPVGPVTPEPFGNTERPTLELFDAQTRPVPMIAQAGSIVDQQTAAPVAPVERGTLADIAPPQTPMALSDYTSFASMPNYPGMDQPMGIDAMTTAANANMANLPAIDPNIPLGMTPIPVPQPRPLAPLPPPVNVPTRTVASPQQQPIPQTPPPPPPPSGMDVWQGVSNYGRATDGSTLSRNPDGTVSRYSEKYDNWSTYNPQTDMWLPGGGNTPGINLPSKERAVEFGKQTLGPAAGGLLGSALMGPVGGILGALVARNLVQGKGILGNGGNRNTFPPAPNAFPSRPSSPGGKTSGGSNLSYSDMAAISPAAADSIARGETVGLF